MPSTPMVRNQHTITGPAAWPICFDPCFCTAKRDSKMITAIATFQPCPTKGPIKSSAERTEMDGVSTESPTSAAQPSIPSVVTHSASRQPPSTSDVSGSARYSCVRGTASSGASGGVPCKATCISTRMPPSPWWLAFMTTIRYLMQTVHVSTQKIMEKAPFTSSASGVACSSLAKMPLYVYSGDVPVSPKTTPVAPSASHRKFRVPPWPCWPSR
mmetsp:Transcript_49750/g.144349  ORF Transcript_49750/g.144349 Transcript_49750/m.144349 type:complete len:214 (+) Transcript_49750:1581-2222(+)